MIEEAKLLLRPLIKKFEGLHKLIRGLVYPYLCPAGYWTHGYGKLCSKDTPPITPQEAEADLEILMPGYMVEALKLCPGILKAPHALAVALLVAVSDFCFNFGAPRLRGSTLRKKINEGDWEGALAEFPKWKFGGGKVLPGLVARRAEEVAIIRKAMT